MISGSQPELPLSRWFLLTGVLSLPFLYVPGDHPGLAVLAALLLLSPARAYLKGFKGEEIHLSFSPEWLPLGLAFIFSLIHTVFSPNHYYSADFQSVFLLLILLLIILNLNWTAIDPFYLVFFWCVSESAVVIYQVVKGTPPLPTGTLINRNYLATLYLSFTGFGIGDLARGGRRGRRAVALWAVILISTMGILAIGSRSGMIGLVILWAVAAMMFRGKNRMAVFLLLVLVSLLPFITRNRSVTVSAHDPYSYSRVDIWRMAVKMGKDHPIAGVGPDLFGDYSTKYSFPVDGVPVRFGRLARKPHSDYLRAWAEGGLVGVLLAFLFMGAVAREVIRLWRMGRIWPALAIIPFFFQALFHDLTLSAPMLLIFMVWLHLIQGEMNGQGKLVSIKGRTSRVVVLGIMLLLFVALLWNVAQSISDNYWNAGRAVLRSQPRVSEGYLRKAARYSPFNPGIANDLGYLYLLRYDRSGNFQDYTMAETSIIRSSELNRNDPTPFLRLADLYTSLANRNPDSTNAALQAAESSLDTFLEMNPNNAMGTLQMARIKKRQGDIPAALDYVQKALSLEPNFLQAHRERIALLSGTDPANEREAMESLRAAGERIRGYRPKNGYESILLK